MHAITSQLVKQHEDLFADQTHFAAYPTGVSQMLSLAKKSNAVEVRALVDSRSILSGKSVAKG